MNSEQSRLGTWRTFERSTPFLTAKMAFRQLIGTEPRIKTDVEVDTVHEGGWTYCPQFLSQSSIIYSFGIGDDLVFELNVIRRSGAAVYAFDPTVTLGRLKLFYDLPDCLTFHPWAAAASDGMMRLYPRVRDGSISNSMFTFLPNPAVEHLAQSVHCKSIPSVAQELGHEEIDILKIDIEGAEYAVLAALLVSKLRPKQILVEFHHRHPALTKKHTVDTLEALRNCGYKVFSCSPTIREVGLLRE